MANRLKNCICQKSEILAYKGTDVLRKWRANGDGCGKKWVYWETAMKLFYCYRNFCRILETIKVKGSIEQWKYQHFVSIKVIYLEQLPLA